MLLNIHSHCYFNECTAFHRKTDRNLLKQSTSWAFGVFLFVTSINNAVR